MKGYITVQEVDLEAVKSALPLHLKLTLNEVGCIRFEVNQRANNPLIFDVNEEFCDEKAFELHQLRIIGTEWAQVTHNVARHYEINKVKDN